MLEKIEVFYGPTKFGDTTPVYHKYIIYTNSNGDRYYARGGPGNYGPGAQNGKDVSSSPFGPIDTEHGKYEVDTPDWDSDNNNPSEFIKEGNDLTQDWKNITDAMDRLKDVELPYLLDSRNSNSAVDFALRESGLREPQRDGIDELWSPGSGDLKLLSPMELYF